ncbi:MAG: restriction endonuclease subunit S, partial [Oscillospiraceae bacterium]|nr:restriction endonuclease subunit S [Oscillospiraceae bacterium]
MARLGDICTVVSGSTPKTSVPEFWDGDIKWISPAELNEDSFYIFDSERHITQQGKDKTGLSYMPAGTVILSSRAPIGKTAIAGCEMCCNQGFKNLICSDKIFNEYLYYFLKGKTEYLNSLGRGATFKEISKSIVENIEISLPTVEEQKQIACRLGKIYHLIFLRKQQLAKLDELVKSRFIEMFGDPVSNPYGYPKVPLSELAEIKIGPFGSLLHKEDYIEGGHAL